MKIGSKEWSDLMIEGARTFGLDLNPSHTRQFGLHADELLRWNRKINITAITEPLQIAVKHFLDALSAAPFVPPAATLLDIGSGGGFPGLPLKVLMPSLAVTLIDASRKKVNFLKQVIRTLNLTDIEALHIRAEDFGRNPLYRHRFDVVISRAVSSLRMFANLAIPLLANNGTIIALKGDLDDEELKAWQDREDDGGEEVKALRNQFSVSVKKFQLPFLNANRSLIHIRKKK